MQKSQAASVAVAAEARRAEAEDVQLEGSVAAEDQPAEARRAEAEEAEEEDGSAGAEGHLAEAEGLYSECRY